MKWFIITLSSCDLYIIFVTIYSDRHYTLFPYIIHYQLSPEPLPHPCAINPFPYNRPYTSPSPNPSSARDYHIPLYHPHTSLLFAYMNYTNIL